MTVSEVLMEQAPITDQEFALFQRLIYRIAGINLADSKKILLVGRLQRRLRERQLASFGDYYRLLSSGQHPDEQQTMVDLLTTNETYFFRESRHFDFLRDDVLGSREQPRSFRVWSAASSSGEEAYSVAMVLAEALPNSAWEVFGSDISTQVLAKARTACYPVNRNEGIPEAYRRKYCLPGERGNDETFQIAPRIRQQVRFAQVNLTLPISAAVGSFDVILVRNVMIYFDAETKRKVVANLLPRLLPGGYFIVGHSESLNGVSDQLSVVKPTIYRKPK
ncbi:MAG: protein-glutamate O-methyltransferase CheR [Candidatus Accumulibacter phosphatis]|jgi:chemotaxis protein methyltransferase CheR|uniref:CheR family methyltransferase n=1 Tax=Candidatus Accumulibacter sp. ACC012 TaxID=2823332 RepID=UPI0025BDF417|nr:protein-glutamate O-methyltransferase CheR [Candidatus Accumulibacter sp. ACC012]